MQHNPCDTPRMVTVLIDKCELSPAKEGQNDKDYGQNQIMKDILKNNIEVFQEVIMYMMEDNQ